jgi:dihydroflavonol-4-reductase
MKILVTGASGFLGNNLVRTLLAGEHEVVAVIRDDRQKDMFPDTPLLQFHEGDLSDIRALLRAAEDCEAIVHTAADTRMWPSHSDVQFAVNVEYTNNVLEVARQTGAGKIIHVSTVNTLKPGRTKDQPGTEAFPEPQTEHPLGYVATKRLAQQMVLRAAEAGLPAVVVNPSFMLGPNDHKPSSGALLQALLAGKVPGYTAGGRNFVHVQDVVAGIVAALAKGRPGECYILGHQNLSYREFFEMATGIMGRESIRLYLPPWLATGYGFANVAWSKVTGKTPALSQHMARAASEPQYYSPAKAVRELELPQTPIETAVRETLEWFARDK